MIRTSRVGKRGAYTIPEAFRKRYGIAQGSLVIAEARDEGILLRPVAPQPLDTEERLRFLKETNAAFAQLRQDGQAWAEYQAGLSEWDATLADGLGSDDSSAERTEADG